MLVAWVKGCLVNDGDVLASVEILRTGLEGPSRRKIAQILRQTTKNQFNNKAY
jgi:hypothetical protein